MKKLKNFLEIKFIQKFVIVSLLLIFQNSNSFSIQDTITVPAIQDNTLYEDPTGSISNGQGKYLYSGKNSNGLVRRGLIRFLLIEFMPQCSKILSVTLKMHLSGGPTANRTIQLRKITNNWSAGSSDAPGLEENGTSADSYDATWLHKYYNTDFWNSAGGDYSSIVSGSTVVGGPGYYTWNSTPQMVKDAQEWKDSYPADYGWMLLGDESVLSTDKRFHSNDADTGAFAPELIVVYETSNFGLYMQSYVEGFWDGNDMIEDTLKVKLRNSTFPYAVVDSAAAVCGTYGGAFCFYEAPPGDYYISVYHRNTIETWSKLPVTFMLGDFPFYDFTDLVTKAYGDNEILKQSAFCMYSGDVNQDGIIDAGDLSQVENDAANSLSGYVSSDVSGDDFVDAGDLSIVENNIGVFAVTP